MLGIEGREAPELSPTSLSDQDLEGDVLREWMIANSAEILVWR
jgi:hypothetical protein